VIEADASRAIAGSDRIRVWAPQLKAGDFPAVCAVSGMPAETWLKVAFVTAPRWAWALLALATTGIGLLPIFIVMRVVSRSAGGYVPVTRAVADQRRRDRRKGFAVAVLFPIVIIAGGIVGGAFDTPGNSTPALVGLVVGAIVAIGAAGVVVARYYASAIVRGRVTSVRGYPDNLVELRGLNPGFVSAFEQFIAARESPARV
jgi:hypothetical protein